MRKLGYLVVEGPHDVEFACRLLKDRANLARVSKEDQLESPLRHLVPSKFPHDGDLLKRVPVPTFLQNADLAVAVHSAGGDSKIADCLIDTFTLLSPSDFIAVGAILDSDSKKTPTERHAQLLTLAKDASISFPALPGVVSTGTPRCGVYVLPDNVALGTLEDLLIECGEAVYPHHLQAAKDFIASAMPHCPKPSFKDLHLPAGQKKALVGSISTLLRPGKAVQVSIQDNDWLGTEGLKLDRPKQIVAFFDELFGL
ncbi:DUF3226 domain-containing protein [Roseateles noduli]|uniref:DUF3226 domain-containing protein n=1 Tax=Roseateles noduli TaxID=2052484 RepID=UPI003D655AD7